MTKTMPCKKADRTSGKSPRGKSRAAERPSRKRTGGPPPRPTKGGLWLLFGIYLAALIWIIVCKPPFYGERGGLPRRSWNPVPQILFFAQGRLRIHRDAWQNLLVFVPYGVYLSTLKENWGPWRRTCLFFATSLSFELLQYLFATGRSDITDLITNTLGGIAGMGVAWLLFRLLGREKGTKWIARLAGAATAGGLLLLLPLLLRMGFRRP